MNEEQKLIIQQCPNCIKLNKLIDDLYKFMNNLFTFMHEQGFKFENMDYNNSNQLKISTLDISYFFIYLFFFVKIK